MSTLNILLSTGKLHTKILNDSYYEPEMDAMRVIIKENIPTKDIQSIWVQPAPIQITLEDLEL